MCWRHMALQNWLSQSHPLRHSAIILYLAAQNVPPPQILSEYVEGKGGVLWLGFVEKRKEFSNQEYAQHLSTFSSFIPGHLYPLRTIVQDLLRRIIVRCLSNNHFIFPLKFFSKTFIVYLLSFYHTCHFLPHLSLFSTCSPPVSCPYMSS